MKGKLQAFINSKYSNIIIFAIMFIIPFIVYRDLYAENFLLAGGDGLKTASNLIFMKILLARANSRYGTNTFPTEYLLPVI